MKKTLILIGLILVTVGIIKLSYAADNSPINNLQFAQFLIQKLNITLPVGADKLPQDQYYKAMADALAAKGITYFQGASATDHVSCSDLGDVLYAIVGGKEALDTIGKLNWLVSNGFLATCPADPQGKVTMDYLQSVFNNPKLSTVIAEPYGPPPEPMRTQAPEEKRDNPVDQY